MTARGSTPEEYYKVTGETIGQAVARIHKTMSVEHAAHYIGFVSSTDLRRYLARRGIPDPWPLVYRGKRKHHRISEEAMVEYCRRILRGEPKGKAERDMGYRPYVLSQKMRRVSAERENAWWEKARLLEERENDTSRPNPSP